MKNPATIAVSLLDLADMPTRETNPDLQKTEGANARWYIRPVVWARDATGEAFQAQRRIYIGSCASMSAREAEKERARVLALLNDPNAIAKRNVFTFAELLETYRRNFLSCGSDMLSESTRRKYESLLRTHIEPAFGPMELGDITPREVGTWLLLKSEAGMSWAARSDLRNLLGSIFSKAANWGIWEGRNPARGVPIGRKRAKREKRKITILEMRSLLAELRPDMRLLCMLMLFTTLRISEALALTWRSIDYERGMVMVRRRFWRGDLDETKTQKSRRDVPLGRMVRLLVRPDGVSEDDYIFNFETNGQNKKQLTRDDRVIRRYFLRPAAVKLGLYYEGFGFHSFRREAVTGIASAAGDPLVAQLMAGHTSADMTLLYGLVDNDRATAAVEGMQQRFLGDEKPTIV